MDLGLVQREVAQRIGVNPWTVSNWEKGRTEPAIDVLPAIVQFLGFDPAPREESLPRRIRTARRQLGLSQAKLAAQLGLDDGTIRNAELARRRPTRRVAQILYLFLKGSASA